MSTVIEGSLSKKNLSCVDQQTYVYISCNRVAEIASTAPTCTYNAVEVAERREYNFLFPISE